MKIYKEIAVNLDYAKSQIKNGKYTPFEEKSLERIYWLFEQGNFDGCWRLAFDNHVADFVEWDVWLIIKDARYGSKFLVK